MIQFHVFHITGTQEEITGLATAIKSIEGVTNVTVTPVAMQPKWDEEPRFGHGELVQAAIDFAVAVAAPATIELARAAARRYRNGRGHMKIEEKFDVEERRNEDDSS